MAENISQLVIILEKAKEGNLEGQGSTHGNDEEELPPSPSSGEGSCSPCYH